MFEILYNHLHGLAFAIALLIAIAVILVSFLQNFFYIGLLGIALASMLTRPSARETRSLWGDSANVAPGISIIVPAFNEEATVVESVRSLLALHYPKFEVIVVNDGSSDNTAQMLIDEFDLVPSQRKSVGEAPHKEINRLMEGQDAANLTIIDKVNGGKADALNAGINHASYPLICTVDADSLLESDSLLRAVQPFLQEPETTIAVGGTVRVANGCSVRRGRVRSVGLPSNYLALVQTVEYLRAFMMARFAFGRVGALTIVSGAFGLFDSKLVREVGGYSRDTVGEDLELVIKLHRLMRDRGQEYNVAFVPEPVCWTQVPEDWRTLARQRVRWQRGAIETIFKHKDMLPKPRYGRIAVVGLGSMLLIDVIAPIVELLGYIIFPIFYMLGLINWPLFAAYLLLAFCFGIFISVGSLLLEDMELRRFPKLGQLMTLLVVAIVENFGYRQIHNFWRFRGLWQYLRGVKSWGKMARRAFHTA